MGWVAQLLSCVSCGHCHLCVCNCMSIFHLDTSTCNTGDDTINMELHH